MKRHPASQLDDRKGRGAVGSDDHAEQTLGARLTQLMANIPREPGGALHSNASLAEAVRARGVQVTPMHISHLRNGRSTNPSFRLLAAIASVYGVPVDFFAAGDHAVADRVYQELQTLAALRDRDVHGILARAQNLSEHDLRWLTALLDALPQADQADDDPADQGPTDSSS